jgi:hypothetical protein
MATYKLSSGMAGHVYDHQNAVHQHPRCCASARATVYIHYDHPSKVCRYFRKRCSISRGGLGIFVEVLCVVGDRGSGITVTISAFPRSSKPWWWGLAPRARRKEKVALRTQLPRCNAFFEAKACSLQAINPQRSALRSLSRQGQWPFKAT